MADIQVACGLTAGPGALYKHFPSKGALLEAAVQRNLELMALRNRETVAEAPADPREALRLMASVVWSVIEGDRDLIRIMLREYHGFSELFERMWQSVIATLYREAAQWIRAQGADVADPEATAAVLISSLTYYPLLNILIGRTPGDLEADRLLDAWVEHAVRSLEAGSAR